MSSEQEFVKASQDLVNAMNAFMRASDASQFVHDSFIFMVKREAIKNNTSLIQTWKTLGNTAAGIGIIFGDADNLSKFRACKNDEERSELINKILL